MQITIICDSYDMLGTFFVILFCLSLYGKCKGVGKE